VRYGTSGVHAATAVALTLVGSLALSVATAAAADLTPQQEQGRKVYFGLCINCHAPGLWGTNRLAKRFDKDHAVLDNRTDLAAATVRVAIRVGIGSMPPLRKTEVSDADVDAVSAYLTRKR
jgi:mono/diheme cytochrome c family protein